MSEASDQLEPGHEVRGLEDFKALLRLQEKDSIIDQLVHRREHLPEHSELAVIEKKAGELRPSLMAATTIRDEVATEQARLEAEVDSINRRIAEINARLYGSVPISPKDAQAMSEEVTHLGDRRHALEEQELEVMEKLEPLQTDVSKFEAMAQELSTELQGVMGAITASQDKIDAELTQQRSERAHLVATVPVSLFETYERLRPKLGGVAVAALVKGSCSGCHLVVSPTEIAKIHKAPDTQVIYCEECGRILVR